MRTVRKGKDLFYGFTWEAGHGDCLRKLKYCCDAMAANGGTVVVFLRIVADGTVALVGVRTI